MKPRLGAKINCRHPLARGLVGCWLFNEGGGSRVFDSSGRNNQGYFLGNPTRIGDALNLTPTDSVEIPQRSPINNLPQFSVAIRTKVSASGIGAFVFNKGGGLQATSGQLVFGQFNLQIDIAHSSTNASARSDNLTNFLGVPGLLCYTFDGVNAPRIFWLGSEVPYGLSTAPSGTRTADNTFNFRINRNHFSGQGVTARHNYAILFNRPLQPSEIATLSANPYAFIDSSEDDLGFVLGGLNLTLVVSDSFGLADANGKSDAKSISDSVNMLDARKLTFLKSVADNFSLSDSSNRVLVIVLQLSDAFSLSSSEKRAVTKTVTELLALNDLSMKLAGKPFADSFGTGDAFTKRFTKGLQELFTLNDLMVKSTGKSLLDTLTLADLVGIVGGSGRPGLIHGMLSVDWEPRLMSLEWEGRNLTVHWTN